MAITSVIFYTSECLIRDLIHVAISNEKIQINQFTEFAETTKVAKSNGINSMMAK